MTDVADNPGPVLCGTTVAPGLAVGPARRPTQDLSQVPVRRVPRDRVEEELNRFQRALAASHRQLQELRERLSQRVPVDHARILDTHLAYLKDSVFLSDVENLVLGEQLALESAIAKVILDFDRIFRLVENELLRERAIDLRDVGIRVLRNLERERAQESDPEPAAGTPDPYVLVARELSIVDMFGLESEPVLAYVTEAGSLTSHAAILARSMRVPTLIGVEGLLEEAADGDLLLVDASEGRVRVRPDPQVVAELRAAPSAEGRITPLEQPRSADGVELELSSDCGNLAEVERAAEAGVRQVGLYRTELLYRVERERPPVEALSAHYGGVLKRAGGAPVTFRLLDLDSSTAIPCVHELREPNPQLGRVGVRALLAREVLLRGQLAAILRAAGSAGEPARLAVPKVTEPAELQRVREVLFEERHALKKDGVPGPEEVLLGVILETPAAALAAEALVAEADQVLIGLDALQQYLLATDREHPDLGRAFERLHPVVLRVLAEVQAVCVEAGKPPVVFGVSAALEVNVPALLGLGFRRFALSPLAFEGFVGRAAESPVGAPRG